MQSRVQKALAILSLTAWCSIRVHPGPWHATRENKLRDRLEISPGLQTLAKPQSLRVAIKVSGKILFINLGDVVSVQAKGKCVWLQAEREFLSTA